MDVAHLMAAAVLFDIDGVLVLSWRAIPGAAETVRQLTHRGIACAYLTNTTTRTRRQIAEALGAAGIPVAADDVITAGVLTAEYLHGAYPGARCFLVNNGDITEDLPGIDVVLSTEIGPEDCPEAPDVVVLGSARPPVRSPHAQPGLWVDARRRSGGGDAPQYDLEHHRRAAHRHRDVPDRNGTGLRQDRHRHRQACGRGIPGGRRPRRCRSTADGHDRRRSAQRRAGRPGGGHDGCAGAHRQVPPANAGSLAGRRQRDPAAPRDRLGGRPAAVARVL
ncbi:LOW QUALITY PROTEIN: predicted protein, partial [Mycobacterium tuberculosis T85]